MAFENLQNEQYTSLTTFRKNGNAVPTPVWFAQEDDKLYVMTLDNSGKIKRLRHTSKVTVAPCTARGSVTGDTVDGVARIIEDEGEAKHADQALSRKYGLFKAFFTFIQRFMQGNYIYVEIKPD